MVCQGEAMVGMLTPCSCSAYGGGGEGGIGRTHDHVGLGVDDILHRAGDADRLDVDPLDGDDGGKPFGSNTVLMYFVKPLTMSTKAGEASVDRKATLIGFLAWFCPMSHSRASAPPSPS
jgi:hypothetical protein